MHICICMSICLLLACLSLKSNNTIPLVSTFADPKCLLAFHLIFFFKCTLTQTHSQKYFPDHLCGQTYIYTGTTIKHCQSVCCLFAGQLSVGWIHILGPMMCICIALPTRRSQMVPASRYTSDCHPQIEDIFVSPIESSCISVKGVKINRKGN